ncbi:MAG TPA: protein kinase [Polyangiaceae bacterium]|nr:protein kinase [Polyangiaceae bacterium]
MTEGAPKGDGELAPGDECDEYRIVSLIAAGGMGDVYEAIHRQTGKTLALKCLKVRHRNKEDARARMKMEAVVLSELQHANLVQVYDAGVNDLGMVWIAMERLHGQTLRDILHRAGELTIPDALYYASEIADGVDAVHEVNVIHRDLKPENVFVTSRNVVKVLDLGTGKFTGYGLDSTDRMRVIGTTAYMSPEQIKGLRVDARADIYALGLMVYEMIAGHHPLSRGGIAGLPRALEQVALMQLQMSPKALGHRCPPYVSALVDKAIAKERDDRFPNMATFSRELRGARKRYVAEHRLDASSVEILAANEGLREKFGAPPRQSSNPSPLPAPTAEATDTVPERPAARASALHTEIQPPPNHTIDGATPVPARIPTAPLSSSSIPAPPSEFAPTQDGLAFAAKDDFRNKTTHTNPLGFGRGADLTPEPYAVPEQRRRTLSGLFTHPIVRRALLTLGLGALIGIPPAVIAVVWSMHRPAATAAPEKATLKTAQQAAPLAERVTVPPLLPARGVPPSMASSGPLSSEIAPSDANEVPPERVRAPPPIPPKANPRPVGSPSAVGPPNFRAAQRPSKFFLPASGL